MNLSNFTFVDVETTGLNAENDRVIEIGILRVENDTVVKSFKSCVNPKRQLTEEIKRITGISQVELMLAPTFDQIAPKVLSLFPNSIIVAHNADFDYDFLENEFSRLNMDFTYPRLCTLKLCKEIYPFFLRYDLGTILRKMKIRYGTRHRAFEDASYVYEVLKGFKAALGPEEFQKVMMRVMQNPTNKRKRIKEATTLMELF